MVVSEIPPTGAGILPFRRRPSPVPRRRSPTAPRAGDTVASGRGHNAGNDQGGSLATPVPRRRSDRRVAHRRVREQQQQRVPEGGQRAHPGNDANDRLELAEGLQHARHQPDADARGDMHPRGDHLRDRGREPPLEAADPDRDAERSPEATSLTGAQAASAQGRFVLVSVTITNRLELTQTFDKSGTQQAGLILDGTVYKEDTAVESRADSKSCLSGKASLAPGESRTCQVVFDVPAASAGDLGKHGRADLYLVDFGSDLSGSLVPQTVGQIRLYR